MMAVPSPTVTRGLFIILLSHFHFPLIVICKFKKNTIIIKLYFINSICDYISSWICDVNNVYCKHTVRSNQHCFEPLSKQEKGVHTCWYIYRE